MFLFRFDKQFRQNNISTINFFYNTILPNLILKYDNEHQHQLRDTYNLFVKKSEKLEPIDEAINEAEAKSNSMQRIHGMNYLHIENIDV